jgi:hypothetical protein
LISNILYDKRESAYDKCKGIKVLSKYLEFPDLVKPIIDKLFTFRIRRIPQEPSITPKISQESPETFRINQEPSGSPENSKKSLQNLKKPQKAPENSRNHLELPGNTKFHQKPPETTTRTLRNHQ